MDLIGHRPSGGVRNVRLNTASNLVGVAIDVQLETVVCDTSDGQVESSANKI